MKWFIRQTAFFLREMLKTGRFALAELVLKLDFPRLSQIHFQISISSKQASASLFILMKRLHSKLAMTYSKVGTPPPAATGSATRDSRTFRPLIRGRRGNFPKKTSFITFTGCCIRRITGRATRITSPKNCPASRRLKDFADFQAFAKAGRELAHWHLDYETVAPHPGVKLKITGDRGKLSQLTAADVRVTKMKFAKMKDPETNKSVPDKRTVIYNERITMTDIPLEAYDYVVNGKPALEWVMERQAVTTDKKSGITNDANDWATETMGNPRYPLELFQRVGTVSLETMKIVNSLPKWNID